MDANKDNLVAADVPEFKRVSEASIETADDSFQDLIAWVDNGSNYSIATQRIHISNLKKLGTVLANVMASETGHWTPLSVTEVRLHSVPAHPEWVSAHLPSYRKAIYGVEKRSLYNILWSYRKVQRARGRLDSQKGGALPPDSEWSSRLNALPEEQRWNLVRMARYAHASGVPPSGVDDEFLSRFRTHLANRHLRANLDDFVRNASNTWNAVVAAGAMGPHAKPLTVPRKRAPYVRREAEFHPNYPQQRAEVIRLMTGSDRKRPPGRREPARLKPRSIKTYMYAVDHGATALAEIGRDPKQIQIHDLVEPQNFASILEYYYRRARCAAAARTGEDERDLPEDVGTESQVIHIAKGLIWVARHYCRLAAPAIEALSDEASRYRPKNHPDLHPKVRGRLDQIYQPGPFADLLHLAPRLERMAYDLLASASAEVAGLAIELQRPLSVSSLMRLRIDDSLVLTADQRECIIAARAAATEAVRLAMASIAVEIEMHCPLRLDNLTRLRLGENVVFGTDGRNRVIGLRIPSSANKSPRLFAWAVERKLAEKFKAYLRDFHPLVTPDGSVWLFPGAQTVERPRSVNAMTSLIIGLVDQHVRVAMNMHLFRAFCACNYLEMNPGSLNDVRRLLGHGTFEMTLRYYAYVRPKIIASRQADIVETLRQMHKPHARPWRTRRDR